MRRHIPLLLFACLLVAAGAYLLASTAALPERVASHFAADGTPNGFMHRDDYRQFILLFGLGLPVLVASVVAFLPRLFTGVLKLPHRDYWLAPERREQSLGFLGEHGWWLGCLLVLLMCGVHRLIALANAPDAPPSLGATPFFVLLGLFTLGLLACLARLMLHFRRPVA